MAKNVGKIFEGDFASSVPSDVFIHRLKDSAMSYNKSKLTSYTWNNECDFYMYDGSLFYSIECKSTQSTSMSVELVKDDEKNSKMIKKHQIDSLRKISEYKNCIAGLMCNFRKDDKIQVLYFIEINDFLRMMKKIDKKSFNIIDLVQNGAVRVDGKLKRTHYAWDIESFLNNMNEKYNKV